MRWWALSLSLWVGLAGAASSTDDIEQLLEVLAGEYRSANLELSQAVEPGGEEPLLWDRRVRVNAPAIGPQVMYLQLNTGAEAKLYRQVLMVFGEDDQGILQSAWRFKDASGFVDAFDHPELFAALELEDLERSLPSGCEQRWTREASGWHGHTNPATCKIWSERRQAWRRIEAETLVTADALFQAERGFDEAGEQVFGTAPGELYKLKRLFRENPVPKGGEQ